MTAVTDIALWPAPSARVEDGRVVVTIDVPDNCHIQSHVPKEPFLIPTTVHVDDVAGLTLGAPLYPAGEVERFDWTPVELDVYRQRVEIVVPVAIVPGASVAGTVVTGRVRYQGCTDSACLPPVEREFRAPWVAS